MKSSRRLAEAQFFSDGDEVPQLLEVHERVSTIVIVGLEIPRPVDEPRDLCYLVAVVRSARVYGIRRRQAREEIRCQLAPGVSRGGNHISQSTAQSPPLIRAKAATSTQINSPARRGWWHSKKCDLRSAAPEANSHLETRVSNPIAPIRSDRSDQHIGCV